MSGFVVSSDEVREIDAISGQRANIIVSSYDGPSPHIPESHHHENPHANDDFSQEDAVVISNAALPSVATLCNSAIGAGVLSLPFAFRKAGMHAWILVRCALPAY